MSEEVDKVPSPVVEVNAWEPRETISVDDMELVPEALEGWTDKERKEKAGANVV